MKEILKNSSYYFIKYRIESAYCVMTSYGNGSQISETKPNTRYLSFVLYKSNVELPGSLYSWTSGVQMVGTLASTPFTGLLKENNENTVISSLALKMSSLKFHTLRSVSVY